MEPAKWERSHSSETTHTAKTGPSMESDKTPTSSKEQVETKPAHSSEITQKCETQPTPNEQSERDPQNNKVTAVRRVSREHQAIATDAATNPHALRAERTQTKLENLLVNLSAKTNTSMFFSTTAAIIYLQSQYSTKVANRQCICKPKRREN
jgi:FtsZ-interacting cell division protein ZipA